MKNVFASLRALWRGLRRPLQLDREMDDEMRFHIEMEAQRLQTQRGLDPVEARRQAAVAFGGVEKYRAAGRDALGLTWIRGLSTDLKLGTRMLRKYPGLTAVALFALSLAIGAGAAYLEFINDLMHGTLPFADADRIVGIQTWNTETREREQRVSADFAAWRESLHSMQSLAAYRAFAPNVISDDGHAEPARGVQITATAFTIARVPALHGRVLLADDERPGAAPVAVIGYELWRRQFAMDPAVVGRSVRLGNERYTIVGVMPEGFGLPVSHSLWVPLRIADGMYRRGDGPATRVFGKLADGVSIRQAQAELDAIALRSAADFPDTHQHLHQVVKPYVESLWSAAEDSAMQTTVLYLANILFIGLLALCGANIATLVFARTATRDTELSVRTALGASRARIAGQLFAEGLVMSALAAVIGLTVARYALIWVKHTVTAGMGNPMMFWWNDSLSTATMIYAAVLAVVAAVIVGVVPALKATGAQVQDRLRSVNGASASGLRFGGVWTGVIVTQVAVTVVFISVVGLLGWSAYVTGGGKRPANFPAAHYVSVRLDLDQPIIDPASKDDEKFRQHFRTMYSELSRRLAADPTVASITYGRRLPGMNFFPMSVEVDGEARPAKQDDDRTILTAPVDVRYFDAFKAPIIAGRNFVDADVLPGHEVAIVERTLARELFNGQAVGRRLREPAADGKEPGPWIEIVGVVDDLTDDTNKKLQEAVLYRASAPEAIQPFYLALQARTDTAALISRLRVIGTDVDSALLMTNVQTMDKLGDADRVALDFFARLIGGVSIVALVLATAGVYALMSFTVARRTSEIGIRVALGANPSRIVLGTFGRALAQVTAGVVVGSIPAAMLVSGLGPEVGAGYGKEVAVITGVGSTLLVAAITMTACVFPARRALRIQPTDALKTT